MAREITLNVNGEEWTVSVAPNETLLEVLRDRIGLKSPKIGCERGDCGSCTVILDGRTVRSCLVLAVEADGAGVLTVEGLSRDGLTELQQSFIDHNSFQCGFCAPGIILTASELLAKNPHPTEHEVKEALAGNLCRCTGYTPIVEAVLDVAGRRKADDDG
ncbi:MAG: 2Fe-2S iron-sulfur cluster binding domain-containing protein [Candidatus Eisenbacteria bacterium]|nr:2Fe-2S iron-sulfur cluster binding domain-containing protein [Candidatus Eisenbacteria bacterium]